MAKTTTVLETYGWKVLKEVGKGGQATVYEVKKINDPNGPSYALKVLRSAEGTQAYERFHREAEALQNLSHPAIVKVVEHKSDEIEGIHFYVMEYIEGAVPLKKLIGTPISPFHRNAIASLNVYIQILEAITACEKAKIVHRDLSLGNVLFEPKSRTVKLIDFGCCHFPDGNCVTLTDEAVGTPHYRAPECAGHLDHTPTSRADLYSAGKILWSVVTNRKAFDREKPVFSNLSLSKVLPDDPPIWHFHDIFAKTIRHNPDHRYYSATEALQDANRIRNLIEAGFPPVELLADERCPICGVGKFAKPNHFARSMLVGPNKLEPNHKDEEIWQVVSGMDLGQGIYNLDVCLNCGFIATFIRAIPLRILKLRASLE